MHFPYLDKKKLFQSQEPILGPLLERTKYLGTLSTTLAKFELTNIEFFAMSSTL